MIGKGFTYCIPPFMIRSNVVTGVMRFEEMDAMMYKIEATSAGYNDFVAGLVRTRYSQNDVEAILCNHGDGDTAHEAEYQAFQEWREQAKEIAKEILERDIA